VAAGGCHTAAVHADGSLWVWGEGGAGQLGVGDQLDRLVPTRLARAALLDLAVLMAACGPHHSLLATSDGGLWACGGGACSGAETGAMRRTRRMSLPRRALRSLTAAPKPGWCASRPGPGSPSP